MRNPIEASRSIEKLNGKMYKGAVIKVRYERLDEMVDEILDEMVDCEMRCEMVD